MDSSQPVDTEVFTSVRPAIGSYEQALTHIGRRSARFPAPFPFSEASVTMFCSMIEDANASYWDAEVSRKIWGGRIVPPPLVAASVPELPWTPDGPYTLPLAIFAVPLPGDSLINVRSVAVHHRPFFVGESLVYYDEIAAISPERSTRLGVGHFLTSEIHYEDAEENPVVTVTNTMFRFSKPTGGDR